VGIGWGTNREIDKDNISKISQLAMKRAVFNMPLIPDFLLVDGFRLNNVNYHQEVVLKGDKKSKSIAAASVVAKVYRDSLMEHFDRIYEGFSLKKNKGYGTKEHYTALKKRGPTTFHRKTFNLNSGN
jgi:ribonuclease HII